MPPFKHSYTVCVCICIRIYIYCNKIVHDKILQYQIALAVLLDRVFLQLPPDASGWFLQGPSFEDAQYDLNVSFQPKHSSMSSSHFHPPSPGKARYC